MPDPWFGSFVITQGYRNSHLAVDGAATSADRRIRTMERGWLGLGRSAVGRWDGTRDRSNGGYGNVVYLIHGVADGQLTDWQSRYAHLARFSPKVEQWLDDPRKPVFFEAGEWIGDEGNTGYVYTSVRTPGSTPLVTADGRTVWQPGAGDLESGRHLHAELVDGFAKTDYRVSLPRLTAELDALERPEPNVQGFIDELRIELRLISALRSVGLPAAAVLDAWERETREQLRTLGAAV